MALSWRPAAVGLEGFRSWSFELLEEGRRHP
ncbi:MAG: hypothetical protein KatS3mg071_2129 [Meiothermus sp.]|nr:MAG: hypothetical protein KatS3mg071_2129 [Meiothermus sp.]